MYEQKIDSPSHHHKLKLHVFVTWNGDQWTSLDSFSSCRYASESVSLACKFAYRNATPGTTLEGSFLIKWKFHLNNLEEYSLSLSGHVHGQLNPAC